MALMLGKRKRRDEVLDLDLDPQSAMKSEATDRLQALFRQHFETNFEPLNNLSPQLGDIEHVEAPTSDSESDSDWDGCSEGERNSVEVVHHSILPSSKAEVPKSELTAFMTAKPPTAKIEQTKPTKGLESTGGKLSTDAANLKKDLELQRLLKESHLLDFKSSLSHVGQNRHKALDLRLQDMGSNSSIFVQQKMPLAQRKGINAKAVERDETRRRQAQENGIILEKALKRKNKESCNRQRGIGAPSIGKFQGGMLKLSKKDVTDIEGPKKQARGRR